MKNKKIGRPSYVPNFALIKKLIKQVNNKKISNAEAWKMARLQKNKMVSIKKRIGG